MRFRLSSVMGNVLPMVNKMGETGAPMRTFLEFSVIAIGQSSPFQFYITSADRAVRIKEERLQCLIVI